MSLSVYNRKLISITQQRYNFTRCGLQSFASFFSRLVRVRHKEAPQVSSTPTTSDGLYGDFTFIDRHNKTFHVGRLQRMQRNFGTRVVDYKYPVSFNEPYLKQITATFCQYYEVGELCYTLNGFKLVSVLASDIIVRVNLSYQNESGHYLIPNNE